MLIGTYEHTVDAKGRLFVPARLRTDLGESFIGTRGSSSCLYVFSAGEWEKMARRLARVPLSSAAGQGFVRMLFANAFECVPDKQGRILIPKTLREKIGLEKEAVITGVLTRAEIWPRAAWEQYSDAMDASYEEQLGELAALGI